MVVKKSPTNWTILKKEALYNRAENLLVLLLVLGLVLALTKNDQFLRRTQLRKIVLLQQLSNFLRSYPSKKK